MLTQLSTDCTSIASGPVLLADSTHEAPAVFEHARSVYLWTSGTAGWHATQAKLLVNRAGGLLGPFTDFGNPTGNATTFETQGIFVMPLA